MADAPGSNGALIARNVALVLGVIALIVWFGMRFTETVSADGVDCFRGSQVMAVPSYDLSACAAAIDGHYQATGFAIGLALVLFIVAGTIHWSVRRGAGTGQPVRQDAAPGGQSQTAAGREPGFKGFWLGLTDSARGGLVIATIVVVIVVVLVMAQKP
jgi:hypothetical protein